MPSQVGAGWLVSELQLEDLATALAVDAAGNMQFTDAVTGTVTLAALLGGGTLQSSYNGGAAITTTNAAGAVTINHASAVGVQGLLVSDASALVSTAPLVEINNASTGRTTGDLLRIDQNANPFTGASLAMQLGGTSVAQQAITIDDDGTGVNTEALVAIAGGNDARTGAALRIALTGATSRGSVIEMAAGDGAGVSAANEGRLRYDTATQTFQVSLNGAPYSSLAAAAGNNLQASYAAGTTIGTTTALGTIGFSGSQANNDDVLTVTKSPAAAQGGAAIQVTMPVTATGNAVNVDMTGGSGDGVNVEITAANADVGVQGLVVTDNGTGVNTAALCLIDNGNAARTTGVLLSVVNDQDSYIGDAVNVTLTGASIAQQAIVATDNGTGINTAPLVALANTNAARTTGSVLAVTNTGDGFTGDALSVALSGTSAGQQGVVVSDAGTGVNTASLIQATCTNDSRTTGPIADFSCAGDALTAAVLAVSIAAASSSANARGVSITDAGSGANTALLFAVLNSNAFRTTGGLASIANAQDAFVGDALNIALSGASTAQQAIVVTDAGTGLNTNALVNVSSTNDVRTTANLVDFSCAGDLFTGAVLALSVAAASSSGGAQALVVTDDGTGVNTAALVLIDNNNAARTTGGLLSIAQDQDAFTGDVVNVALTGASTTQQALVITEAGTGAVTTSLVSVAATNANRTSGALVAISNTGNAYTGDALNITVSGTSNAQRGAVVIDSGTGANLQPLATVVNQNDARTSGDVFAVSNVGDAFTGSVISATIGAASSSTTAQGLTVTDAGTGINTANLVEVTSTNDARTIGNILAASNAGDGLTGAVISSEITAACSSVDAQGLIATDNGTGVNIQPFVSVLNSNAARTIGQLFLVNQTQNAFVGVASEFIVSGSSAGQACMVLRDNGSGANTVAVLQIAGTNNARTGAALRVALTGAANLGNTIEMADGVGAAVSGANEGRLRYNATTQTFQASLNTAAYSTLLTAATSTLQVAYDANPTISTTVANGAVTIEHASAVGVQALLVSDASALASTAPLVEIDNSSTGRTSGSLLSIDQNSNAFTGDAINIDLAGTSTSQQGLVVTDNGTGANIGALCTIANANVARTSGNLLSLSNTGNGFTGDALLISLSGTSTTQQAVVASDAGSGAVTTALFQLSNENDARTSGDVLNVANGGDGFTGAVISAGITAASSSTSAQGLVVTDSGTGLNTAALVEIVNLNTARRSSQNGFMLKITGADSQLIQATMTPAAASNAGLFDFSCVDPNQLYVGVMASFSMTDANTGATTVRIDEAMTTVENLDGNLLLVDGSPSTARGFTATADAGVALIKTQGNKPAAGAGANPYSNAALVLNNTTAGQVSWLVLKDTANKFWRLYVTSAGVVTTELC